MTIYDITPIIEAVAALIAALITAFVIPYIKYIDNIRMCQSRSCLCLATEFTDKCSILPKFRF